MTLRGMDRMADGLGDGEGKRRQMLNLSEGACSLKRKMVRGCLVFLCGVCSMVMGV